MESNRPFLGSKNRSRLINKTIRPVLDYTLFFLLLFMLIKNIIAIGFQHPDDLGHSDHSYYQVLFTLISVVYFLRATICAGFKSFESDFYLFTSIGLFLFLSFFLR